MSLTPTTFLSFTVLSVRIESFRIKTTVGQSPVKNVLPSKSKTGVIPSDITVGDMVACLDRLIFGSEKRSVSRIVESPVTLQSDRNSVLDADEFLRKMMLSQGRQQIQRVYLRLPSSLDDNQTRVSRLNVWKQ